MKPVNDLTLGKLLGMNAQADCDRTEPVEHNDAGCHGKTPRVHLKLEPWQAQIILGDAETELESITRRVKEKENKDGPPDEPMRLLLERYSCYAAFVGELKDQLEVQP